MFDLTGRVAVVTGATGGIGAAVARALHGQGAHVVLAGRRRPALEALGGELERSTLHEGDLAGPGQAESLIAVAEAAGGLSILVNNAGITRDNVALRMKDEEWSAVIETNLTAVFRLGRAALKGMMKRRFGRIVNVTSVVGATGNPGQANYAAAKAGLVGMSKALAQEIAGRGITVNCVAPGFIETPMTEGLGEGQKSAILSRVPLGRLGRAEEVAAAIVYLASDEASYVTGHTLHVNGGMAML